MSLKKFPQVILCLLVGLVSLLWTVSQNYAEFSPQEMAILCAYAIGIFIAQGIVVGALALLGRKLFVADICSKLAATIFTTFNIYTLIIVHNARFAGMDMPYLGLFLIGSAIAVSALFFVPNESFKKFTNVFAGVMIAVIAVQLGPILLGDAQKGHMPEHFRIPTFKTKPNVYVITLDALSPEAVMRQNVGIQSLPYVAEVKDLGGKIIPNAFAERIPTKRSLNSFLAMDLDYYKELKHQYRMITGEVLSPAHEIFRRNGYKVGFMYDSAYFGGDVGGLDYYGIAKTEGICNHIEKKYALLGYCTGPIQKYVASVAGLESHEYPDMLFDRIRQISKSGEPWFMFAHVYQPGHAKNSYSAYKEKDKEDFKIQYETRAKTVAKTIHTLVSTIREADPTAVLIIFGDHGALTSVGLLGKDGGAIKEHALDYTEADMPKDSPMTYRQLVQDRHAVFAAVFPKDFCKEGFVQNPFATVRVLREVFKCLSGGEDPLPADFQPNDDKWIPYKYQ